MSPTSGGIVTHIPTKLHQFRIISFYHATACNAINVRYCCRNSVCPSVCLSVRCVYCDKTKWCAADILIPHKMAITLVFWQQQWLVGDNPFPVKYSPKVTHPRLKLIVPCNQYFICIRQTALQSCYSCLAYSKASSSAQNHWQCWQLHNGLLRRRQSHGLSDIAEILVQ